MIHIQDLLLTRSQLITAIRKMVSLLSPTGVMIWTNTEHKFVSAHISVLARTVSLCGYLIALV